MSASSLVELSASAVIQDRCIVDGCDLSTLPRTVLQELLLTSISQSRMLCLRTLITNWPMKHLVLQNVSAFDEPKAVLLAYCLQRTKHDLKLVDIRGCNIGESNKSILNSWLVVGVRSLMYRSIPKPPIPPRANPGAFDFFEKFWSNSPLCCQFRRSNAPPVRASKRVKSPTLQGKQNRLSLETNRITYLWKQVLQNFQPLRTSCPACLRSTLQTKANFMI